MQRAIEILAPGVLAAVVAVVLLWLVDASLVLATAGALGAAIPVSLVYAMITLEESSREQ